jgi:hypothetical protein
MKTNTEIVHYGKLLKKNMEEKGVKHTFVLKILNLKAYETLNNRFSDGAFSFEEVKILTENGLL